MSRGLIPLATNVGAIPGVVNNLNGFLIEPGNIEQIVEYLVKIIEMTDTELLVKKHYSLKMIENNFNWDKLSKELLNFIESVR
jgi:glycosyltransferase involved in cell wall biosynthesis